MFKPEYMMLIPVLLLFGCENSTKFFNVKITNKSGETIWVENAFYGKGDLRCGALMSDGTAELSSQGGRRDKSFPEVVEVVWWVGDRNSRPTDESLVKRQTLTVTQPTPVQLGNQTGLELWINLGEDGVWRQVIPE